MRRRGLSPLWFLLVLLLLGWFCSVGGTPAGAEEKGGEPSPPEGAVRLEADRLVLDGKHWVGEATGAVRIRYQGTVLEAEEIYLDLTRKTSHARRRVRLLRGEDVLRCEELSYHWEDQTGSLEKADLLFGDTGYHIQAEFLEKTGTDTYIVEKGKLTTCLCPSPDDRLPWEIEAEEGEVFLNGYAKVRKAKFRLFGYPVLYLPIAYLPVKIHRGSGFLTPGIGRSGRHGWEFRVPYYWAINASADITFSLEGLTKRGAKPSLEVRYRPNKKTTGKWFLSGMQDMKTDAFRYGLKAEHLQRVGSRVYDKLDLNLVSDNNYTEDFPWEVANPADRILVSRGIVGFRDGNVHASLEGDVSDLVARVGAEKVPQRMPHVHLDLVTRPVVFRWLSFGLRSEAVHFVNEKGEERVREQILPRGLVRLQPLGGLSLSGQFGVREVLSQYPSDGFGGQGSQARTLLETGAEVEGTLSRRYRSSAYDIVHIIRPSVRYQWVRAVSNEAFPVIMDGLDALESRNWLTYSIYTSVWGRGGRGKRALRGLIGEAYVSQSIDLEQDPVESPTQRLFSDIVVGVRARPRPFIGLSAKLQMDPYGGSLRTLELGTSVRTPDDRYRLSISYLEHKPYRVDPLTRVELWDAYSLSYFFAGITKTLNARAEAVLSPQWSASFQTRYLMEFSGKVENHLSVTYLSACKCWAVDLSVRQTVRPDDVSFSVRFRLSGLGSYLGS